MENDKQFEEYIELISSEEFSRLFTLPVFINFGLEFIINRIKKGEKENEIFD